MNYTLKVERDLRNDILECAKEIADLSNWSKVDLQTMRWAIWTAVNIELTPALTPALTLPHTDSIQLQGIGKVHAKPASELKVGDVTIWNYGYREMVETIEIRGNSVYVTLRCQKSGQLFSRRFLQSRLVGISSELTPAPKLPGLTGMLEAMAIAAALFIRSDIAASKMDFCVYCRQGYAWSGGKRISYDITMSQAISFYNTYHS